MIKKILFILNILVLCKFNAQIKINFTIDHFNKTAKVILVNETNADLVIPWDTFSFSPYFDDICLEISNYIHGSPYLGLNIKINENNKIVESLAGAGKMNDLNDVKKISLDNKKYEKEIKLWQKRNGIKSFDIAKINYYIFNNLIHLKPREKIEKILYFDLHNITNGKYLYYYYHIEDGKQYDISVSLNIEDCVYKYLTKKQIEKVNKYKLFTGMIESNKIEYKER